MADPKPIQIKKLLLSGPSRIGDTHYYVGWIHS